MSDHPMAAAGHLRRAKEESPEPMGMLDNDRLHRLKCDLCRPKIGCNRLLDVSRYLDTIFPRRQGIAVANEAFALGW